MKKPFRERWLLGEVPEALWVAAAGGGREFAGQGVCGSRSSGAAAEGE
jgi:hypothetical protein